MCHDPVEFARQVLARNVLLDECKAQAPTAEDHQRVVDALRQAAKNPDTNVSTSWCSWPARVCARGGPCPTGWRSLWTAYWPEPVPGPGNADRTVPNLGA